MRLTNKDYKEQVCKAFDTLVFLSNINPNDVLKFPIKDLREQELKLGQLEDIEEELGIDLITLFKALKNGSVYMFIKNDYNENYRNGLIKPLIISTFYKYGDDYKLTLCDTLTCLSYSVSLKDYGKTWALTKVELL